MGSAIQATAREYLRVSKDQGGSGRSTTEQHDDNAKWAEGEGWRLGEPYRDVDRSASRYARREREGYERLIADLAADRFGADVLVMWESSRGSRKVGEWVALLELLEERGVLVAVTTHRRTYDPRIARDRRSMLEDSVDSEYESAKMSARIRRDAAANAAAGRPNGRVPFGYRREYDPATRQGHQLINTETAPLIRELFDRVQQGDSFRAICQEWNDRGIVGSHGKPFTQIRLREMAMRKAYAGIRTHTVAGVTTDYPATWEPIVPRSQFIAVQRILTDPARTTRRPGRAVHLLSRIAKCGKCGAPMTVSYTRAPAGMSSVYYCPNGGHAKVEQAELDESVTAVVLAYLASDKVQKHLHNRDDADGELEAAKLAVATVQTELDELADEVAGGRLSAALAARAEPGIQQRLDVAQQHLDDLRTPSKLRGLLGAAEKVEQTWNVATLARKREILHFVLSTDLLGELHVMPTGRKMRHLPAVDRIELRKAEK